MRFERVILFILALYIIFSIALVIILFWTKNPASSVDIEFVSISIIVISIYGFARIFRVKNANKEESTKRKVVVAAQHSWLVFSLATAVIALSFGSYFKESSIIMLYQDLCLTVLSLLAVYLIVEAAREKLPFMD